MTTIRAQWLFQHTELKIMMLGRTNLYWIYPYSNCLFMYRHLLGKYKYSSSLGYPREHCDVCNLSWCTK